QGLVPKLARRHGIDKQARSFSAWSHLVSLLHAQLTHAIGRIDVCDSLRQHARWFGSVRGATPPTRNTLSHVNKMRRSDFMQELFWNVFHQLPFFVQQMALELTVGDGINEAAVHGESLRGDTAGGVT
ncbi:MAG: DUF4372 domain-containing protein, partial [Chthoniobacterales bacterium]